MNKSIGIFDSGLGGLTVVHEIAKLLPNENIVYFGDCGRTPYGTRSTETIIKYVFQDIRFLLSMDVKMIVIACNTASAFSLPLIKNEYNIPVIEVIHPGANAAVEKTRNGKIGVIGTNATINSKVYQSVVNSFNNSIDVFSKACPLFVPLVEEGWWEHDITVKIAEEYLNPLKQEGIDTLIFGCTHYPLLEKTIKKVMGDGVNYINSAQEVAKAVKREIEANGFARNVEVKPTCRYFTSDSVSKFKQLASAILKREIDPVERVEIEKY